MKSFASLATRESCSPASISMWKVRLQLSGFRSGLRSTWQWTCPLPSWAPVPPGLQKRSLPGDLRALLPIRAGQDFRVVGNDIVLIETATSLILDVMQGVLR